ncbi:hypothetical protein F2Q70_00041264 [Brassica cretica]|uniref:Uncharacterized protein n=1 Tax=Brassica cretica TaxID=69181 RepID=A0A8S9KAV9_BRACR|nr:hypothetical protein F2Q70_00041264 [Brassica cretica]
MFTFTTRIGKSQNIRGGTRRLYIEGSFTPTQHTQLWSQVKLLMIYEETQGDSSTLSIAAPGPESISHTCGSGMMCPVVLVTGSPLMIEYLGTRAGLLGGQVVRSLRTQARVPPVRNSVEPVLLGTIDALSVAWLPGTEGDAESCLAIIPSTACCHARG